MMSEKSVRVSIWNTFPQCEQYRSQKIRVIVLMEEQLWSTVIKYQSRSEFLHRSLTLNKMVHCLNCIQLCFKMMSLSAVLKYFSTTFYSPQFIDLIRSWTDPQLSRPLWSISANPLSALQFLGKIIHKSVLKVASFVLSSRDVNCICLSFHTKLFCASEMQSSFCICTRLCMKNKRSCLLAKPTWVWQVQVGLLTIIIPFS